MRLGVYMGSFDPVHKGHINIVNYLLDNKYVDKVLIIPTVSYWNKNIKTSLIDRINMLRFYQNDKIIIDSKHNNYIYTIELLKELEKEYNDKLYLIIGADNLKDFDKWKNYKELLRYPIIVMGRNNINCYYYINKYKNNNFIVVDNFSNYDISSTMIRDNYKYEYLDKEVYDYIKNNNLYLKS